MKSLADRETGGPTTSPPPEIYWRAQEMSCATVPMNLVQISSTSNSRRTTHLILVEEKSASRAMHIIARREIKPQAELAVTHRHKPTRRRLMQAAPNPGPLASEPRNCQGYLVRMVRPAKKPPANATSKLPSCCRTAITSVKPSNISQRVIVNDPCAALNLSSTGTTVPS